jgi:hypothetical protein
MEKIEILNHMLYPRIDERCCTQAAPILGRGVSKSGAAERLPDRRGAPDGGSRTHDDLGPTKASSVAGGWVH